MKKYTLILVFSVFFINIFSQEFIKIFDIPRNDNSLKIKSLAQKNEQIITKGIITLVLPQEEGLAKIFIQDKDGDNNPETSDAIFVKVFPQLFLEQGAEITLRGKLKSDEFTAFLDSAQIVDYQQINHQVEATNVVFPDDFQNSSAFQSKEGMTLIFAQTLVVTSNANWQRYGELLLSSLRLASPTDVALPASADYQALVSENAKNQILLDDGSTAQYPNPLPFADANGTRRTGSRVNNLTAVLNRVNGQWTLYPQTAPVFYGNDRPTSPQMPENYNVKVCSFNLEYYLASNYGEGYGADDEQQAAMQHNKILRAVMAIDADIYGLVEIQDGQTAIQKLCNAMNVESGANIYSFINDGSSTNGTFTKAGFIYRNDKIAPVGMLQSNQTGVKNRKKAQCFKLFANDENFIFSINHFKAKSGYGSGDNADKGDGQGSYNADRVAEANAIISAIPSYKTDYKENDVLIMGDLNAYRQEDPLRKFYENDYFNLLTLFNNNVYSYSYRSQVGCLDHALANNTMAQQVTSAGVFHINVDEPSMFDYWADKAQNNMYRCSDHDAVVVTLNLGTYADTLVPNIPDNKLRIYSADNKDFTILNAGKNWLTITDIGGKQILHRFISENETELTLNCAQLGMTNGVYLFFFDNMKSKKPKTIKYIF
ncbi:MAG: ExeM/NucH family extracellular endonuclease [Prevotellaceae bacterium]|jgi:predicted extracellular nuclease|nr:ExeM/NucH family extracellular endonuclease [Prevotellaceae bacterium]